MEYFRPHNQKWNYSKKNYDKKKVHFYDIKITRLTIETTFRSKILS